MKRLFNYLTILFAILLLPTSAFAPPIRSGGPIGIGGGGSAESVLTDTDNFDGALTAADDNVQAALDTLDDYVGGSFPIADGEAIIFDESAADPDDCDVEISATDGVFTIGGAEGENNEDITFDFDSAADTVTVSSSTGATIVFEGGVTRETSAQPYTASGNITEAHILANKYITNRGAGAEIDLVLPDLEYYITVIFIINEAFVIEINPPNADTHEEFDLDGVILDESDCIDSTNNLGAKIAATRMQWSDGTWKWSFDTIRNLWVDTGATD